MNQPEGNGGGDQRKSVAELPQGAEQHPAEQKLLKQGRKDGKPDQIKKQRQ